MSALQANGGRLNPIQDADATSLVTSRIKRAKKGRLRTPTFVKTVRSAPDEVNMFELRWGDDRDELIVSRYDAFGHLLEPAAWTLLRMYYVEQPASGAWFLGLHVHEKLLVKKQDEKGREVLDQGATDDLQQGHVERALATLRAGAKDHCGVPELTQHLGDAPLAS